MFELLLGLGFGSIIGLGAKMIKEGVVLNPRENLGEDFLNQLEEEAHKTARQVVFDRPADMKIRGE